jgi:hypothetical protein
VDHLHGLGRRAQADLVEQPRQQVGERLGRPLRRVRPVRAFEGCVRNRRRVARPDGTDVLTSAPEMPSAPHHAEGATSAQRPRPRRVALDAGYDRLGQRHVVRYACERCSREKDAARTAKVDAQQKPL